MQRKGAQGNLAQTQKTVSSDGVLTDQEKAALREILELVMPYSLNIRPQDIVKGYQRNEAIERILRAADRDILTPTKLRLVYGALQRCYEHGI